jgi:hypothetical protein
VEYANLFLSLIGGGQHVATKIERIQYGLSLIDELLSGLNLVVKVTFGTQNIYSFFSKLMKVL